MINLPKTIQICSNYADVHFSGKTSKYDFAYNSLSSNDLPSNYEKLSVGKYFVIQSFVLFHPPPGAAFTRFQTLRLKRVFPDILGDSLISYGSCQFPTLGFVVERYKEIERFVSEKFWKLKVTHEVNDLCVEFAWKRVRLFEELFVKVLLERCLENKTATVLEVTNNQKNKWRPTPLDTVVSSNQYNGMDCSLFILPN